MNQNNAFNRTSFKQELFCPGGLTIILQGGLFKDNLVNVANHIQHIRKLFNSAQIILSISSSDLYRHDKIRNLLLTPRPETLESTILCDAVSIIESMSEIILASGALPLPGIKADSGLSLNNFNLQLSAARAGLELARGKYVLRVRSDMCFLNDSFIDYYEHRYERSRVQPIFIQRVLISGVFSVNPFLSERMPFHYSDWFHFGLTEDIRALWAVEPMTYSDAVHFRVRPHDENSNVKERDIFTKLAVEQHLYFSFYKTRLDLAEMKYFNDLKYRDLSMRVLIDDFVVMNPEPGDVLFPKYQHVFDDKNVAFECITPAEWDFLSLHRQINFGIYFEEKIKKSRRKLRLLAFSKDLLIIVEDLTFFFFQRLPGTIKSIFFRSSKKDL